MDDDCAVHVSANPADRDVRYDVLGDVHPNYHGCFHDHCDGGSRGAYSRVLNRDDALYGRHDDVFHGRCSDVHYDAGPCHGGGHHARFRGCNCHGGARTTNRDDGSSCRSDAVRWRVEHEPANRQTI